MDSFVQQQLLRSRDPSSNLIERPVFSLCKTKKNRRTGAKKKKKTFKFSVHKCSRSMWKHHLSIYCFIPACHCVQYSFSLFALSVESPLGLF